MTDDKKIDFELRCDFEKVDDELRIVYGWASVTSEANKAIVDLQGDIIEIADLQKAAHDFITFERQAGDMHVEMGVGTVVDSVVFTADVQKSLGIDLGRQGWWIGMKVTDDSVWKRVKSGDFTGFSIGGTGNRTPA